MITPSDVEFDDYSKSGIICFCCNLQGWMLAIEKAIAELSRQIEDLEDRMENPE